MKKQFYAAIGAALLSVTAFASFSTTASAYDYDNNGVYHAGNFSASLDYSKAYLYFKQFGWGWSYESKPLYKNGQNIATMYAYFNPELVGASYAYEHTGCSRDGIYIDGQVLSNGSCVRSKTLLTGTWNGLGYIHGQGTDWLNVWGTNNCNFLGSIYW